MGHFWSFIFLSTSVSSAPLFFNLTSTSSQFFSSSVGSGLTGSGVGACKLLFLVQAVFLTPSKILILSYLSSLSSNSSLQVLTTIGGSGGLGSLHVQALALVSNTLVIHLTHS